MHTLMVSLFTAQLALAADPMPDELPPPPTMQVLTTAGGARFGLFGEKPTKPAPTLFIFAQSLENMVKNVYFIEVGRRLALYGFLYVVVDPPCHGVDSKPGEPPELRGWRYRVENNEALVAPFTTRATAVLDHLVTEGYTDPAQVAACGTSRGGFLALQFAAAEPRVRAVVAISPVTDLAALSEFKGLGDHPNVVALKAENLAEKLAGRPVWISIGNNDRRVDTDDAIATTRKFTAAGVAKAAGVTNPVIPVELIVGRSPGHGSIDGAYELAAEWLLRQVETPQR